MRMRDWNIKKIDKKEIAEKSKRWGTSKICTAILIGRGFKEDKDVKNFIDCPEPMDPFEFTDMKIAVECIKESIEKKEKICVYGDYDADGITATALLYSYLKSKGADVIYYIPSREKEGYGLNIDSVKNLYQKGVKVLITVDNGISAYDEIEFAVSLGMKVIVTDHHKLPEKIPPANAVVNPCREKNWDSKIKNFCGAGVVYKIVEAIEGKAKYIDLAVLGTIGDSMPLFGESRIIVKRGLESISSSEIPGIKNLIEDLKIKNKSLDSIDLAFKVVPRINASGRMNSAEVALELLIEKDEDKCRNICSELNNFNLERKDIEKCIIAEVENKLSTNPSRKYENIIVIEGENWHHGVIGIVASKISEKYGKPCILISSEGNQARGSCRSMENFSIYDAVFSCRQYLQKFGGHTAAAGINLETDKIKDFSDAIINYSRNYDLEFPKIDIDAEISLYDFSKSTLKSLEILKPFGCGNPEPIFCVCQVTIEKINPIGNGNHLKLKFYKDGCFSEMLYFNKTAGDFLFEEGQTVDVSFTMQSNFFKGRENVSGYIVDLKLSNADMSEAINGKKIYEKFKRGEKLSIAEANFIIPSRDDFIKAYRFLSNPCHTRPDIVSMKIFGKSSEVGKIYVILDAFEEMNLINLFWNSDEFEVEIIKNTGKKVNLMSSNVMICLNKFKEGDFK